MSHKPDRFGPKCCICDGFLVAGDKVIEVERMYQSAGSSWPTPVRGGIYDSHAHLHHFLTTPTTGTGNDGSSP